MSHGHEPVLMEEVMTALAPQPGDVVVDCTVGRGGHAEALARAVHAQNHIKKHGTVIGFDLDSDNLQYTTSRMEQAGLPFIAIPGSFVQIEDELEKRDFRADVVLADLGFSSNQMESTHRGLSFLTDGPLDMRLDPDGPTTAADLIASMTEQELADIIYHYGEEPLARRIARNLALARKQTPIHTTAQLAELVRSTYGSRAKSSRMHPATRTFMALRIAVNDELAALRSLMDRIARGAELAKSEGWLNDGARIAVISFHSLEDRIVKHAMMDLVKRELATKITKKPITASDEEIARNPRARSAKLRAIRIGREDHSNKTWKKK